MKSFSIKSLNARLMQFVGATLYFLLPQMAMGSRGLGGDLKAVDQLSALQETISGPILSSIAVIMIVVTSLMLAFGEWGDGFKRLIQIVFWISVAAGASSLVANMMG